MITGALIAESLQVGAVLEYDLLRIVRVSRVAVNEEAPHRLWTLLDFTAEESHAQVLSDRLAASLAPSGGWHVAFATAGEDSWSSPARSSVFRAGNPEAVIKHCAMRA